MEGVVSQIANKKKDSGESCEPGKTHAKSYAEESHGRVLESYKRLSTSQEVKRKTQWSPVGQKRLVPSPGARESHEEVLESHEGLSPSQEAGRQTQQSVKSRERLMTSPRPEGSHGRALEGPQETQYEPRSKEKTQLSRDSQEKTHVES